jgi:hypothetical protein
MRNFFISIFFSKMIFTQLNSVFSERARSVRDQLRLSPLEADGV